MSDSLPVPQGRGDAWSRFSVDPRKPRNAEVRASTADRDLIAELLADAYTDGRLDDVEYQERLDQALAVKTMGEAQPLLADIAPVGDARPARAGGAEAKNLQGMWRFISSGAISAVVIVNLVWAFTSLSAGRALYYWPMWPMLGVLISVVVAWASSRSDRDR